ncbi:MAG: glycosyltransferase [Hungatella sp.]
MVYYKGCDILLAAMTRIPDLDIHLTIVGSGVLETTLKAQTKQAGIQDRVCFAGRVSDEELQAQIEACDVFVFPSVAASEAFGLVQLEAMIYGKPVINTKLPTGVPCVSLDGETGLTVPVGDATSLSEAILWMKNHWNERIKMGENARERVKTQYTEDVMIKRLLQLYKEIV